MNREYNMRMIKIFLSVLLFSSLLSGAIETMEQLRAQQRYLVLAEFKSLYKQRHYYQLRARLDRHHQRTKRLDKNSIFDHAAQTVNREQADPLPTMMAETVMAEGADTTLKTKANHDMKHIEEIVGGLTNGGNMQMPEHTWEEEFHHPITDDPISFDDGEFMQPDMPSKEEDIVAEIVSDSVPVGVDASFTPEPNEQIRPMYANPWKRR